MMTDFLDELSNELLNTDLIFSISLLIFKAISKQM